MFAVCWGNGVELFQFQNLEEEKAKGIKYVGQYKSDVEIRHIEWISENNILMYDYKNQFKLLYTSAVKPPQKSAIDQDPDNPSRAMTSTQIFDAEVATHIYNSGDDNKGQLIPYYSNTIVGIGQARRVFVLGSRKLSVGRHIEWKEHLETLKNKAEWLSALSFCITLYKGESQRFADLPNDSKKRRELIRPVLS